MSTSTMWKIVMSGAGAIVLAGTAHAGGLGAGSASVSVIAVPNTPGSKTLGKFSAKPLDSKAAPSAPSGGLTLAFKFSKAATPADPLKPGLAPGEYVAESEGASPSSAESTGGTRLEAFIRFTVGPDFKCTIQTNPLADTGSLQCGGGGQPACAPAVPGKCSATQYQIVGPALLASIADGSPTATRTLIRTAPDPAHCCTGDIALGGTFVQQCNAPSSCKSGTVVGIVGLANGKVQ